MPKSTKISESVIRRLPRYYRHLGELLNEGVYKVSSRELAESMHLTASQIRQDLNNFGGFGQQGYGYNVEMLRQEIAGILKLNQRKPTILIGAGNLGKTIATHINFSSLGFDLSAVFDSNEEIIGRQIGSFKVKHTDELESYCKDQGVKIAVLCIPKNGAIKTVKELSSLGIEGFWNFSSYDLQLDYPEVKVENVHLTDSLMALSFRVGKEIEE